MNSLYELMVTLGGYMVIGSIITILVIIGIVILAKAEAWFTEIAEGTTVFISSAQSLEAIWPNVKGHRMSTSTDLQGHHWLIPESDKEEGMKVFFSDCLPGTKWCQKWLWKKLGIRSIGWLWPQHHVYHFDIRKDGRRRIVARETSDAPLRSRMVDSESVEGHVVNHLLFVVPRPVYLESVELAGDNSMINLLLFPVFQQVVPAIPAYYLKGDFFTLLDAALEAAMIDFFASHRVAVYKEESRKGQFAGDFYDLPEQKDGENEINLKVRIKDYEDKYESSPLTYAHWLKLTKTGERSPMERHLHSLNINEDYRDKLKARLGKDGKPAGENDELVKYIKDITHGKPAQVTPGSKVAKKIPSGMIPRFGFALVSFRVVEWEPHKDTKALADALLAKEIFLHQAEGVRQEAEGVRDAILARAKGESTRYRQLAKALIDKGVTPDVAAKVVETQLRTENISGQSSKVTTYVESGAVNIGK